MGLSRRRLIVAVAAGYVSGLASELVQAVVAPEPRLWGDGIHDDTVALQALFDKGGTIRLDGTYKTTDTLHIRKGVELVGGLFVYHGADSPAFWIHEGGCITFSTVETPKLRFADDPSIEALG